MRPNADLDTLLLPIQPGGVGVDPRLEGSHTGLYWRLRDARTTAREAERERAQEGLDWAIVPEAWRDVERLAIECLTEHAKDFEVALWLMEAWTRLHGLPGLAAAAELMRGLVEAFWENGYPRPESEELLEEERWDFIVAALGSGSLKGHANRPILGDDCGALAQPLLHAPLASRRDGSIVTLNDWITVQRGRSFFRETTQITAEFWRQIERAELVQLLNGVVATRLIWSRLQDAFIERFRPLWCPLGTVVFEELSEIVIQVQSALGATLIDDDTAQQTQAASFLH